MYKASQYLDYNIEMTRLSKEVSRAYSSLKADRRAGELINVKFMCNLLADLLVGYELVVLLKKMLV